MNKKSNVIYVDFIGPDRGVVKSHSNKPQGPKDPKGGKKLPKPTTDNNLIDLFSKKAA